MASFSELILKLGRGEQLAANELADLRDEARAMEDVKNLVKNNSIILRNTFEKRPVFLRTPSDTVLFRFVTDTEIANDTATYITFESTGGKSDTFYLNPSDLSQVKVKWAGHTFVVFGYEDWESNATGYRAVQIQAFDAAGTSLGTTNLHVTAPVNGDITGSSWSIVVSKDVFPSIDYFKMIVRQTSGAGLDLRTLYITPCLI